MIVKFTMSVSVLCMLAAFSRVCVCTTTEVPSFETTTASTSVRSTTTTSPRPSTQRRKTTTDDVTIINPSSTVVGQGVTSIVIYSGSPFHSTDVMAYSNVQPNTTPDVVIAMLAILGLVIAALVVFVVILGFLVRRQREKMKIINNKLAALDCHVKMQFALTKDFQKKDVFSFNGPASADNKRKQSAPGFLEGRRQDEPMYRSPPLQYQRKPSLPINFKSTRALVTTLGIIKEEEPLSESKFYIPRPKHLNSLEHDMNQEIPVDNPPPTKHTAKKGPDYINQVTADKNTMKQNSHVYGGDENVDYANAEMAQFSCSHNNVNVRQISEECDNETEIDQPVYSNRELFDNDTEQWVPMDVF